MTSSSEMSGSGPLSNAPGAYAGDVGAPSSGSVATKIAIGVVVAAVAIGGLLALRPKDETPTEPKPIASTSAAPVADDPATQLLLDAQKAADNGDWATMLAKLDELPQSIKDAKRVETTKLYTRWAESSLEKAKKTKDGMEIRKLLMPVAANTGVPLELRNAARELLDKLPPEKGGSTAGTTATTAHSDPPPATTSKTEPGTAKTAKPPAGGDTGSGLSGDDALSEEKRKRAKAGLDSKVGSGKASTQEIRMLKALCQSDGDKACVARANAALQKAAELGQNGYGRLPMTGRRPFSFVAVLS
jgi:hypothetical protein